MGFEQYGSGGQGPGEAEWCEDAGGEHGHGADLIARQGDDQQAAGVQDVGVPGSPASTTASGYPADTTTSTGCTRPGASRRYARIVTR